MIEGVPLRFGIPEPPARPGERADFSYLGRSTCRQARRPDVDTRAERHARPGLLHGPCARRRRRGRRPWAPEVEPDALYQGLRAMVMTRAYDDRMPTAQRQGKTSFYMRCTGEEAIAVGHALELHRDDMFFPTYRNQGWLIARRWPLVDMMCQVFSNEKDRLHGRQMPIMYSAREVGFFSISGNLGTQYIQAVGWAMASAIKGDTRIASGVVGEGTTAEADFHHALTFATTYQAPVILNIVNNQWAISTFQGHRRRRAFNVRGARHRPRHPGAARRRQRLPGCHRRHSLGRRAGSGQPRPDGDRVGHVPGGRAFDIRRSVALPAGRRVEVVALG